VTQYLGIDWAYRRAAWCARSDSGAITGEGLLPADEDGLIKLVLARGSDVKACVEMMSGAVWVRDRLAAAGWEVQVAHAGKVRDVAPLACKTDKVDARVLAELCRRDLVPALWIPSLEDRALRERLRRRMHLVRLRASAMNRIFGLLTQSGLRLSLTRLRALTRSNCSPRAGSRRDGGARSQKRWRSLTCSTSASHRCTRSCDRSQPPIRVFCCCARFPASVSCSG
jgi:transposase